MSKRDLKLKIDELSSSLGTFKGLEIEIGRIFEEDWEEPIGPTPFPTVGTLRNWDRKLLNRYKPFYMPFCDLCCLCTYGKCDLTGDKRGACGITMAGQQSRIVLIAACIGASTHTARVMRTRTRGPPSSHRSPVMGTANSSRVAPQRSPQRPNQASKRKPERRTAAATVNAMNHIRQPCSWRSRLAPNDQAHLRPTRDAGWTSSAAPCSAALGARSR